MAETIQAVMVVPILAPRMMQTACFRVRRLALTSPTTRTVMALELWIRAVMVAPARIAM